MKQSLYRAFGYVFIINESVVGDIVRVEVTNTSKSITYCVSGDFEVYDADTNEKLPNYSKGAFYYTFNEPKRNFNYICIEDSKGFCFDPTINNNVIPSIEKVFIPAQSTKTFAKDTKFLLMGGNLVIKETTFTGPARIQVATAETLATAITDCYGIIIE